MTRNLVLGKKIIAQPILTFIDKVAHAIDDVSHTIGVFLDFSKAFDTIDHDILIHELRHWNTREGFRLVSGLFI